MAAIRSMALAALLFVLFATPPPAHCAVSNVVTEWLDAARAVVRGLPNSSNQVGAKLYGYLGLLSYRAIQRVEAGAPEGITPEAAAAYAAHSLLSAKFPQAQGRDLDPVINRQLGPDYPLDSVAWLNANVGKIVRDQLSQELVDRYFAWRPYKAPGGPLAQANGTLGLYRATNAPLFNSSAAALPPNAPIDFFQFAQLGNVVPRLASLSTLIRNASNQNRLYTPHPVRSPRYQADLEETREWGGSTSVKRSAYDENTPAFWAFGGGTATVLATFLKGFTENLPPSTTLKDTAKFVALVGLSAYDASIGVYHLKYWQKSYPQGPSNYWRPVTALRQGDGVNAPLPSWSPKLTTPAHPEFPSGHGGISGAALEALRLWQGGSDEINFTIPADTGNAASNAAIGSRTYTSIATVVKETNDARVYGGVHFRWATIVSNAVGKRAAQEVFAKFDAKFPPFSK